MEQHEGEHEHVQVQVQVPLFRRGFGQVLATGEHADAVVVVGSARYRVHRIIVASASEFFQASFAGGFTEAALREVVLGIEDEAGVFPDVLRFIYEGDARVTPDNVLPLLAMSDMLLIAPLRAMVLDYLGRVVSVDNALSLLDQSIRWAQSDAIPLCNSVVVKNFHVLSKHDFSCLPPTAFLDIMADPALAVKSEKTVFYAIGAYIAARNEQGDSIAPELITQLYETVRYPFMPYDLLVEAQASPLVPQSLLVEGLMARLRRFEVGAAAPSAAGDDAARARSSSDVLDGCPADADTKCRLRHTRRPPYSITFRYDSGHEFYGSGIIHWIATNECRDPWVNPSVSAAPGTTPKIQVTVSSLEKGELSAFLARDPAQTWTMDVPASWVTFDLGPDYSVVPSHYSLRHGGNYKADSLRNWDLQGSTDGLDWHVLYRHVKDTSLNGPFATATWPIADAHTRFRFFRILQTGHNSSRHNFLVLCGFELYGDLYCSLTQN